MLWNDLRTRDNPELRVPQTWLHRKSVHAEATPIQMETHGTLFEEAPGKPLWKSRLRSGWRRILHKKSKQTGKVVVVSPSDDSFLQERPCQQSTQTNPQCGSVKQDNQKQTERKTDSHPQTNENAKKQ